MMREQRRKSQGAVNRITPRGETLLIHGKYLCGGGSRRTQCRPAPECVITFLAAPVRTLAIVAVCGLLALVLGAVTLRRRTP
jgi:hypothetical protein